MILSLLSVSGQLLLADCCKPTLKDGKTPDKCTNRAVILTVPKADGSCMAIGDLFSADGKKVKFGSDQQCPDCKHYVFDHNCDDKNKYKNNDASSDAWASKNAKVISAAQCK